MPLSQLLPLPASASASASAPATAQLVVEASDRGSAAPGNDIAAAASAANSGFTMLIPMPGLRRRPMRRLAVLTASSSTSLLLFLPGLPPPPDAARGTAYNASKLALLIEDRPLAVLAPALLHFTAVLPPDWGFLFLGSAASLAAVNGSAAVRDRVRTGRLALRPLPAGASVAGPEMISRFLTSAWLYADWLLVFQTDSMVCANSRRAVDDFLAYDWVGAPWNPSGLWGGNGGLSLRRVGPIRHLRSQRRVPDSEPEDVWFSERLLYAPGSNMANGSVSLSFSGEMHAGAPEAVIAASRLRHGRIINDHGELLVGLDDWRHGFYEPLGYHGGGGAWLHAPLWGTPELRKHVWSYCPEFKMMLRMDVARYVPGNCAARWV